MESLNLFDTYGQLIIMSHTVVALKATSRLQGILEFLEKYADGCKRENKWERERELESEQTFLHFNQIKSSANWKTICKPKVAAFTNQRDQWIVGVAGLRGSKRNIFRPCFAFFLYFFRPDFQLFVFCPQGDFWTRRS